MTSAIIPARFASTRFPGKPLVSIHGKTMIMRVYEQCLKAHFKHVIIATDSEQIMEEAYKNNAQAVMTDVKHENGTQRCAEAALHLPETIQNIVNVQGDEPFIAPSVLNDMIACLENEPFPIVSFYKNIEYKDEIHSPNVVKLVTDNQSCALYFSRSCIPYNRDNQIVQYKKHIGLYGFKRNVLNEIIQLPKSNLELIENLEQLRWLSNGYSIKMLPTDTESIAIDTPEDLEKVLQNYSA